MNWATAENAIVAWVRAALAGVSGLKVAWAYQSGDPFATPPPAVILGMAVDRPSERGYSGDTFDADADEGAEITTILKRHWRVVLLGDIRTANVDVTGAASPHALVTQLLTNLRLPGTIAALKAAGLGLIEDGVGDGTPELFKNVWQPRALFTVAFQAVVTATETVGYFDEAQVGVHLDGSDTPTTVSLPLEAAL